MHSLENLDVTERIQNSGLADTIVPLLSSDDKGNPCTTDDFAFALAVREEDQALMLQIRFAASGELHRTMVINTERKKLGLLIELTKREVATLIRDAIPLLTRHRPAYSLPKNAVAA